jgi:hypothetical protein
MGVRTLTRLLRGRGPRLGSNADYVDGLSLALKRARRHERDNYKTRDMDDELSDSTLAFDEEMDALDKHLDRTGDGQ